MNTKLNINTNLTRRANTQREKLVILQLSKNDGSIPVNTRVYFTRDAELNNCIVKGISTETAASGASSPFPGSLNYTFSPKPGFSGSLVFGILAEYFTLTLRDNYDNILIEDMPLICLCTFQNAVTPAIANSNAARRFHIDKNKLYGRMCIEKSFIRYTRNSGIIPSSTILYAGINFIYTPVTN